MSSGRAAFLAFLALAGEGNVKTDKLSDFGLPNLLRAALGDSLGEGDGGESSYCTVLRRLLEEGLS